MTRRPEVAAYDGLATHAVTPPLATRPGGTVDIVVTGRHVEVSDRFRAHVAEKLGKIPTLAPRTQRVDVVVSHEPNRRQAKACEQVEITCHVQGRVVRAEACQDDRYAALDVALDKVHERLRRLGDKRRVHRGRHTPESLAQATGRLQVATDEGATAPLGANPDDGDRWGDSPVEVRQKVHASAPQTLDEALHDMELVGHDFYLFHDVESDRPSVVYRRRGWSYGVIQLERLEAPPEVGTSRDRGSAAAS